MKPPYWGRALPEAAWRLWFSGNPERKALQRGKRVVKGTSGDPGGVADRVVLALGTAADAGMRAAVGALVAKELEGPKPAEGTNVFEGVEARRHGVSIPMDAAAIAGFESDLVALFKTVARATPNVEGDVRVRFNVPAIALTEDPAGLITGIIERCLTWSSRHGERRLGGATAAAIAANMAQVSGLSLEMCRDNPRRVVWPDASKNPASLVSAYLKDTCFHDCLLREVPFGFGDAELATGLWCMARPGYGKTSTACEHVISELLDRPGPVSLIVMDSQGSGKRTLLDAVGRMKIFAPGQRRFGDLVRIAPADGGAVAINPFSLGKGGGQGGDLLAYIFADLMGSAVTPRQALVVKWCVEVVAATPGGTMRSLLRLLRDTAPFEAAIATLDEDGQEFFRTDYNHRHYADVRVEVRRRVQQVLSVPALRDMLNAPAGRFDLTRLLQDGDHGRGSVIIVDTEKAVLGESSPLLGRMMISLFLGALIARSRIEDNKRTPSYICIDEAMEYFSAGSTLMMLASQGRKYRGGGLYFHQGLHQLRSLELKGALTSSTGIQLMGGAEAMEARSLAMTLGMSESLLGSLKGARKERPIAEFALRVKDTMGAAVKVRIERGALQHSERMSETEWREVKAESNRRYGINSAEVSLPTDTPNPRSAATPTKANLAPAGSPANDDDWVS